MTKVLVYYLLFFCLLLVLKREKGKVLRQMLWECVGCVLLVGVLVYSGPKQFEVDFLDVGQGDGSFIQSSGGKTLFVDGGSTNVKGVGTYRILPFLKYKGVRHVDYWILSHLDEDHVSGFYEVLESGYDIRRVVLAKQVWQDEAVGRVIAACEQAGTDILWLSQGDILRLSEDVTLQVLAPGKGIVSEDRNTASLVFLYADKAFRGLWTGDITAKQEKAMLSLYPVWEPVTLYKAAHHGSRYSNSADYLENLSPLYAVISCGRKNRFGHPHEEALSRLRNASRSVYRTDEIGQIRMIQEKDGSIRVHSIE